MSVSPLAPLEAAPGLPSETGSADARTSYSGAGFGTGASPGASTDYVPASTSRPAAESEAEQEAKEGTADVLPAVGAAGGVEVEGQRPDGLWSPPRTVQIGGQALVEGVMMRSPRYVAASVRRKDGTITTRLEPVETFAATHPWARLVGVRGVVGLFEMMAVGTRYLRWSGDVALEDEGTTTANSAVAASAIVAPAAASSTDLKEDGSMSIPEKTAQKTKAKSPDKMPGWAFLLTALCSLGIGLLLFVALPHWLAGITLGNIANQDAARGTGGALVGRIGFNLWEGILKLGIFVAYLAIIGRGKNIRRVFEYHGAEHKTVYAIENNCPLTPAGARDFDTPHPRCGTGFALLTILVSVLCFSFLPVPAGGWQSRLLGVLYRLALMPVVAGVSYEIIKLTTHPRWQKLAVLVLTPGLWLQRLTTRQPDDSQLEVACEAMRAVLQAESAHAAKS